MNPHMKLSYLPGEGWHVMVPNMDNGHPAMEGTFPTCGAAVAKAMEYINWRAGLVAENEAYERQAVAS